VGQWIDPVPPCDGEGELIASVELSPDEDSTVAMVARAAGSRRPECNDR
jgi:hypothetical protein